MLDMDTHSQMEQKSSFLRHRDDSPGKDIDYKTSNNPVRERPLAWISPNNALQ